YVRQGSLDHMRLNMRIGTRILVGYALALLVVAGVGAVAYRATSELVDSANWVAHTHKVKEALAETLSLLKDAETGQRGFVLTGEERYLEPYTAAIPAVDGRVQDVRELTADNHNQQRRIATLQPLLSKKLTELAETIALGKQRGGA